MVATSLNHPPFSAGHVLATPQNCSGTHPKDSGKQAKTLALVLLVVVIVIYQGVNKMRPIPGRLSTRSLQRVAIKVGDFYKFLLKYLGHNTPPRCNYDNLCGP